ncbi:hypothetical protein EW146_g1988 [Bondarzewia mesenterica]|uniref:Cytochrome P450 n=1 Tax=Bondarzewia mesenterica TaxID=1095465 RepID=A0A4S4M403_9AGAM|nr:hypothetical protein EW146_g1988 [Bondarzewia mesenterica]
MLAMHSVPFPNFSVIMIGAVTSTIFYCVYVALLRRSLVDKDGNSIPTGPWGLPVVGSYPFLTHYPEVTLDRWAKKFGDLYSIWLGNQLFVVVSDPGTAKDLMVTNGAIFSSRKDMFIKAQTIFIGRGITGSPYNDTWRKHRRIAWSWLQQHMVDSYSQSLDREAKAMIKTLFEDSKAGALPVNPQPHAGRSSLNNMLMIVFAMRANRLDHPMVAHCLQISREFMNCTGPVANLVDFIPLLQQLPTTMRSRGRKLHQELLRTYGGMIKDIEAQMRTGAPVPDCAAKAMIEMREKENLDELDMAILASAFMIAGVETIAGIIQWFMALIGAHPDVQKKAQEELDRVVGRDRMPTIEDEKDCPYCRAIIKEVERCHNPFWLGTPHVNTQDFTYKGRFIPKDTVIICNTYTMHFNGARYSDPFVFNPDRYIDDPLSSSESANLTNPYERDHWMFGVGRRICVGMILADREIWLAISHILWAFNMVQIPEEPIDLKEYDGLSGRSPMPFRIKIMPRHERVTHLLQEVEL